MADIALTLTILAAALTAGLMGLWIRNAMLVNAWDARRQSVADAIASEERRVKSGYYAYKRRLRWSVPTNPRDRYEGSN